MIEEKLNFIVKFTRILIYSKEKHKNQSIFLK